MKKASYIGIAIFSVIMIVSLYISPNVKGIDLNILPQTSSLKKSDSYTLHTPITINSSEDFVNQGFPGDGSLTNPYRIERLDITDADRNLIEIRNVKDHFLIQNNYLNAESRIHHFQDQNYGILIQNSKNGWISSNIIRKGYNGIVFTTQNGQNPSSQIVVTDNRIIDCRNGILSFSSSNMTFSNNIITDCSSGIVDYGHNATLISGNEISFCGYGIWGDSFDKILRNSVHDNWNDGICLTSFTSGVIITHNEIYRNGKSGIEFWNADHNWITNNSIHSNGKYGVSITNSPTISPIPNDGNVIKWNDFIGNNPLGTSQAEDNCEETIFQNNYWSDHDPEHNESDDYSIDGVSNNSDPFPQLAPIIPVPQRLAPLEILTPRAG